MTISIKNTPGISSVGVQKLIVTVLLLLTCSKVFAAGYLVDAHWLTQNKDNEDLIILDIQQAELFLRHHVPGSINAPYSLWRTDDKSPQPGMLPALNVLERLLSRLGIADNSQVVIVNTGFQPADTAAAARVFWTLKTLGLHRVAILNGGLVSYANTYKGEIESGNTVSNPASFKAKFDNSSLANIALVNAEFKNNTQMIDSRTLGEYLGVITAAKDQRPGTLPGAYHLPFDWLVNVDGKIRNKADIITLFEQAKFDPDRDGNIHFCSSGNRAALAWFVDYAVLGHKNARLYDASMNEWAVKKDLPMERHIELLD